MKQKLRRDRLKIYGDLLAIFNVESKKEKVMLTKVAIRLNVPYDRLMKYVAELRKLKLIEDEGFRLTEKGGEYLKEYEKVLDFMDDMGIAYK